MENTRGIPVLVALAVLFSFSLVFALSSLGPFMDSAQMSAGLGNFFKTLAFIGFISAFVVGLLFAVTMQAEGVGLAMSFFVFTGIDFITLIWFTTRVGRDAGIL